VYKRAVVALDGSPVAEAVIPFILEIAGPLDMEVVLVRAYTIPRPVVVEGSIQLAVEDPEVLRVDAEEYLAPLAVELRAKGVRTTTQVRCGPAAEEIVAAAHEAGADLIAMTTHGRSGLGRLLFGSVAEAVLRESKLPVFLLRVTEAQVEQRAAVAARRP
jgi:nucleotide-binding universal stress UspA family protein